MEKQGEEQVAVSKAVPYSLSFPPKTVVKNANYIKTTKYSLLTFLPLNLYFQFKRFYNFYFLLGALSVFAGFSSISSASMIAPLLVVLAFSAVKEAIEDFNRYRADTLANTTPAIRIENGQKVTVESMSLQPGHLVFVKKGSKFYTDCIVLSSAYDDGTVFIETAELDGETNLKRKVCLDSTSKLSSDEEIWKINATVECDAPNANLLNFEGVIKTPDPEPLSFSNFVPRGSVLRNTDHCYALVIYSGLDTKIMKNLKQSALKSSSLEAKLNILVLWAFVYNAVLLVSSVILEWVNYQYKKSREDLTFGILGYQWYIGFQGNNPSYHLWASFISYFTLYTYVIPISLFVTIELVRLGQATFMVWDEKMEYKRQDGNDIPMRVNNSNLNEDLGAVDYIFSDKTGTLTQNSMNMAKWYCEGMIMDEMETPGIFYEKMKTVASESKSRMDMFLVGLTVCHGCIPALDEVKNEIIYESQSPDETALLIGARDNNYILKKRSKQTIEVQVDGQLKKYEVLGQIEFNSTRKRMSVIVRVDNTIRVYTKGADNIMLARLDKDPKVNNPEVISKADQSLTEFSNIGLRTLVIAHRDLSQAEYDAFNKAFKAAEISLGDREELMAKASEMVENKLTLLGCTAIEDKLQDRVPETIENLLIAGIKLWLLTGDKQETAINIGLSSRLINKSMKLLILSAGDPDACEKAMGEMIIEQAASSINQVFALVVDGNVLSHVFEGSEESKKKFLSIGTRCKTVICSRVTPLQKALVVRLVKNALKDSITLAIGDGANDVSMIQEAHVGVGIMGKEGTQAVRAADYAFGEFKFLQRLLTVHGRFNYLRMANLILFSFYKNFVFITIQWYFGFINDWSGQTVFEELFFISYNVIFTSIPPLLYGLYERDLPESFLEKYPQLYIQVKNGLYWNIRLILRWFVLSIIHTTIIFGTVYYLNYEGTVDSTGKSTGYWVQAYLFSTPMLLVVLLKSTIMTRFWIWLTAGGILLSLALNAALMFSLVILDFFTYNDYNTAVILHSLPAYYLLIVLLPSICVLPDMLFSYLWKLNWPSDTDLVLEHCALKGIKI